MEKHWRSAAAAGAADYSCACFPPSLQYHHVTHSRRRRAVVQQCTDRSSNIAQQKLLLHTFSFLPLLASAAAASAAAASSSQCKMLPQDQFVRSRRRFPPPPPLMLYNCCWYYCTHLRRLARKQKPKPTLRRRAKRDANIFGARSGDIREAEKKQQRRIAEAKSLYAASSTSIATYKSVASLGVRISYSPAAAVIPEL